MRAIIYFAAMLLPISAAMLLPISASAELYKCVSDGKITYSDRPCQGVTAKVKVQKQAVDIDAAKARIKREQEYVARAEAGRQIETLQDRIAELQRQKDRLLHGMDRELGELRKKKEGAANNLAGAAWEQAISTEMQAVAARYRAEIDLVESRISDARQELTRLQGAAKP